MMDWLPTFAAITGASLPPNKIDGQSILAMLLSEPNPDSKYDDVGFFYYHVKQLQAVRSGPWKLYLPVVMAANSKGKSASQSMALYHVLDDVSEANEVSKAHPDIVNRLLKLADQARAELGDEEKAGSGQRPAGIVQSPTARRLP
jgi:arylsulfatase A-like enzyme